MLFSGFVNAEFRVEGAARRREAWLSAFLWSAVLLPMSVSALHIIFWGHESHNADIFAAFVLGAGFVVIHILACREALHFAFRKMVFVLNGNEITRKRIGYPDVTIAFSEIAYLGEELGYLIVKSDEPRKKIGIPYSVSGYAAIRTELSKHCELSARVGLCLKDAALLTTSLSSWAAFLRFSDSRIVIPAGGVALITLAISSQRLRTLLRAKSKRSLFWFPMVVSWLVAFLLIYLRVTRP